MNTKKRKLNRGLDALLGTDLTKKVPAGRAEASTISPGDGDLRQLPLEFLQRGKYQPRIDFDEAALQELADSHDMTNHVDTMHNSNYKVPK